MHGEIYVGEVVTSEISDCRSCWVNLFFGIIPWGCCIGEIT